MTATSYEGYEIGFAAEAGWKAITDRDDLIPPWDYVRKLLHQRINWIVEETKSDSYTLYITEGETFRFNLAVTKPYKSSRSDNKPWHFRNLTVHMRDVLPTKVITHIEADDALAIDHLKDDEETVLCSRDKDLRQVPGLFYSWELGEQPSFGPVEISKVGDLELLQSSTKKLRGTGLAFFCAQCLTGDPVDNVPGLPKCGPVAAYAALEGIEDGIELLRKVEELYEQKHGNGWEDHLLEQGRLLWMTRRLNEDGSPVLWELGMME